jgi:hypothetical protein
MHTLSRSNHVKRLNKYLNVPSFMFQATDENGSLYLIGDNSLNIPATEYPANITIEFWIQLLSISDQKNIVYNLASDEAFGNLWLKTLSNGRLNLIYGGVNIISVEKLSPYSWHHIAITVDSATRTAKLYIDSELDSTGVSIFPLAVLNESMVFGGNSATNASFFISEIRIWNIVRTETEIKAGYRTRRSIYFDVEPYLICYWRCTEVNDTETLLLDIVGAENGQILGIEGGQLVSRLPSAVIRNDIYPPLIQGASFPVARADITLESAFSFKHPQSLPNFTTSSMVVTWVDDNEIVQRRYLWKADGVNFGPIVIPEYNGERISASFSLEVWNIDGEDFVELFESKSLRLSITTEPVTVLDTTAVSAGSYPLTNSIFSPVFPVDFPLTFTEPPESGEVLLNIATESGDIVV